MHTDGNLDSTIVFHQKEKKRADNGTHTTHAHNLNRRIFKVNSNYSRSREKKEAVSEIWNIFSDKLIGRGRTVLQTWQYCMRDD